MLVMLLNEVLTLRQPSTCNPKRSGVEKQERIARIELAAMTINCIWKAGRSTSTVSVDITSRMVFDVRLTVDESQLLQIRNATTNKNNIFVLVNMERKAQNLKQPYNDFSVGQSRSGLQCSLFTPNVGREARTTSKVLSSIPPSHCVRDEGQHCTGHRGFHTMPACAQCELHIGHM